MKKVMLYVVLVVIALPIVYGGKHIAHVKCVEGALEMHCKKNNQKVESVEVPWWNPLNDEGYACSAKVSANGKVADIAFTAKRLTLTDIANDKDDWELNLGFWGWIGDDYRIFNVKAK